MPDKQLTIATYAAGASLAAITLVYVFAPTFFIDAEAESNASSRKRGVVGLVNPANDCFINSTVQALAGLGDLRLYLIRETHRRALDGPAVYRNLVEDPARRNLAPWKLEGLQEGIVTQGLKDLLDKLNERPIYKKTISVAPFVKCLETAFRQRISRQQQDAQEFLQIVAERLCDEYHAGQRARKLARELGAISLDDAALQRELTRLTIDAAAEEEVGFEKPEASTPHITESEKPPVGSIPQGANGISITKSAATPSSINDEKEIEEEDEEGFPLEGSFESQIECLTCGFKPAPNRSPFCTLTLNVPSLPSTTLSACFDGIFKTEYIDEFKCEKCRLIHAVECLRKDISKSRDDKYISKTQTAINKIQTAIDTDPEKPPLDIQLPDSKYAPKRKIARHMKITSSPKILSIHLSRSIFEARSSLKNAAKVSFPETLPLGGLLAQKHYKLLAVVTHKGSHHSGHYETFRRQTVRAPFVNERPFDPAAAYSRAGTPGTSIAATPHLGATREDGDAAALSVTPELLSPRAPASIAESPSPTTSSTTLEPPISAPTTPSLSPSPSPSPEKERDDSTSLRSMTRTSFTKIQSNISRTLSRPPSGAGARPSSVVFGGDARGRKAARRHKGTPERWWRISDDKVKECKTAEVLGMQREVYLLFYELQR
jgi:ubiquitin carboxyl-terminal hydrolase 16